MGLFHVLGSIFSGGGRTVEIIVIGLDNSGKTTILNKLKPQNSQETCIVPTVGYNIDRFTAGNMAFTAYDMSGQSRYRSMWETQYKNVQGVIFVVDSSDRLRLAVSRDELWMLLDHKDMACKKVPLLVMANKADLKEAITVSEIHLGLGLDLIRNRDWNIVSSCGLTGQGLVTGIDWLCTNIKQYIETLPN